VQNLIKIDSAVAAVRMRETKRGFACGLWATVCKTVRPILSDRCLVCPVCDVRALWPNGWTDQDETWYAGGHIVLGGDPASPPLKGHPPNFRPISVEAKWLHGSRCHLAWR